MEIIKRGIKPSEKQYEATCRNCDTQIRFFAAEAVRKSDQRDGDYLSIACPVCDRDIYLSV